MVMGMEASQLAPSERDALPVALPDRVGDGRRQRRVDDLGGRDTVERLAVVEPGHFDRPFGRRARAVDLEHAVGIARDGNDAPIEFGRVAEIDLELFLAGLLALFQRRIIEERQAAGPLDLQHAITTEKNHRGMSIDPLAAARRAEAGTVEKIQHLPLQFYVGRAGLRSRGHGNSTAAPVISPARSLARTALASRNGKALVCVLMPAFAATSKNAIPSPRVKLATDSNCRSPHRMW